MSDLRVYDAQFDRALVHILSIADYHKETLQKLHEAAVLILKFHAYPKTFFLYGTIVKNPRNVILT